MTEIYFLTVLEVRKYKIKVLADFVPGEGEKETHREKKMEMKVSGVSSHKGTNLITRAPPSLPHRNLIISKGSISKQHHIMV